MVNKRGVVSGKVTRLAALSSLRFFAAAMIVIEHSAGLIGKKTASVVDLRQGVTLFFILSGFIMVYAHPRLTGLQIPAFWYARFARLWPVHACVLLVLVCLLLHQAGAIPHASVTPLILQTTFLQAWLPTPENTQSFNAVTWTLSVEALFYFIFPLLLWRLRDLWWLEITIAAIVTFLVTVTFNSWLAANVAETNPLIAISWPPSRVFDFVLGMCTAVAFERLSGRDIPRNVATYLELAACGLAVATVAFSFKLVKGFAHSHHAQLGAAVWSADVGSVCFPFAFLILILALERGRVSHAMSWKPLVILGESSYSLYLVHFPLVLLATGIIADRALTGLPRMIVYVAYFPITIAAALLMWICVERPCRKFLLGQWRRRFSPNLAPATNTST